MNIEKIREEFDLWFVANAPQCAALALSGNKLRMAIREMAWFSWQASRELLVIELPQRWSNSYGDWYKDDEEGDNLDYAETVKAIEAAGLKVKKDCSRCLTLKAVGDLEHPCKKCGG